MTRLCVGAASRRVVEEAAKLKVHQIVASRRQVAQPTGYIGLSPDELVDLVNDLSEGKTHIVRDHGGPRQGGFDDDGTEAFDDDVRAGFDALHIDVCELPRNEQCKQLAELCQRYGDKVAIEVGGEHEPAAWNTELLSAALSAGVIPSYVVVGVGTHVWADSQIGYMHDSHDVQQAYEFARKMGVKTKIHNCDFLGPSRRLTTVDAYNIAPEFGQVEVRAILMMLPRQEVETLLEYGYQTRKWRRWFNIDEGTYLQRAECALRYLLEDPVVATLVDIWWSKDHEAFVRRCIHDAIVNG